MKPLIFLLLLIFISCDQPQKEVTVSEITPEEVKIAKNLVQGIFDDVWGGLDSTKILNYHTEDFIILENGEVWDNARISQYIKGALQNENPAVRINKMEYISVDKYGESIQLAYDNYATFMRADTIAGKAHWLESALAVKENGTWKLKMMHSTYVQNK